MRDSSLPCRLATALLALALAGGLAASDPSEADWDRADGEPLVFASDEWCPYVCFETTRPGFLVELVRGVFESPARPVVIRRMAWERAVTEAEAGRIDGVLGAASGESDVLVFPRRAAAQDPAAFALLDGDPWVFTGVQSLGGRTIGVAEGYRFGPPLDDALFGAGRGDTVVEPVKTDNPARTNLQKLVDGRVELVLDNTHVLRHELEHGGFSPAARIKGTGYATQVYVAFSPGPTGRRLAAEFDAHLGGADGRAAMLRLEDEYGPMAAPP